MTARSVVREVLDRVHRDRPAAVRDATDRAVLLEVCRSQGVGGLNSRMSLQDAAAKLSAHFGASARKLGTSNAL
jgi:hypothetical protein